MTQSELNKILEQHKLWLSSSGKEGSKADLRNADLRAARLSHADLRKADLRAADLSHADLSRASLCGAYMDSANLTGAILEGADLRNADLSKACLTSAELGYASLEHASLSGADLRYALLYKAALICADLTGAFMKGTYLEKASLLGAILPENTFFISRKTRPYSVFIANGKYVDVGCQIHTAEEWRKFSKWDISEMDGLKALKFYPHLLDILDFYLGKGERPDWVTTQQVKAK